MPRTNRSKKRTDEMNRIKRARNYEKELIRLKKTVGILDKDGNEIVKQAIDDEMAVPKTPKQRREIKDLAEVNARVAYKDEVITTNEPVENITIVNENTGKSHTFNSKTLKDQYGNRPAWFKNRKLGKAKKKLNEFRKKTKNYKQKWATSNIPL